MEAPSSACPLCYEGYAQGAEDPLLVPRRLPCGDTACTGCLRDSLDEASRALVCQTCLESFVLAAATVEEGLPAVAVPGPAIAAEEDDAPGDAATSEGSSNQGDPALSPSGSRLADFMRDVPASAPAPADGPPPPQPSPALTPRVLSEAEQAAHARAHRRLAEAKLSRLRFQRDGDQAKVDLQSSPGRAAREQELSDEAEGPWGRLDPEELAARFRSHRLMELGEALELIDRSREVLSKEPNILHIQAPVACVGDIHGQFYDLLHLMERGGKPPEGTTYLFLGDYVDRGKYSCEVMLYLLALKVCYPERVFLIRGNHESRSTTGFFGFKEECLAKLGLPAYYRFLLAFECMPLCAVIETSYGRLFAAHGGISPEIRTLAEIEALDRFVEPDCKGALCDILWSDPLHEFEPSVVARPQTVRAQAEKGEGTAPEESSMEEFLRVEFRPNFERGCSYYFGYGAIRRFLDENGLLCLVRAHQVQEEGFRRHFDPRRLGGGAGQRSRRRGSNGGGISGSSPLSHHNVRELLPPVITVFSAPNYAGRYGNKAAFLRVGLEPEDMSFEQFECVPAPLLPSKLPWAEMAMASGHHLAAASICPYMPTTFRELFKVALELSSGSGSCSGSTALDAAVDDEGLSLSRQNSDGSMEPVLTPCDSLTSLGSFTSPVEDDPGAAAAPAPALHESGSSSSLDMTDGERGSSLGSSSLEDRRLSATVEPGSLDQQEMDGKGGQERPREPCAATTSRVFAVIQQFEDANSRIRGAKRVGRRKPSLASSSSSPSSPPRRRGASAASAATSSPSSSAPKQPPLPQQQQQQQQNEPRPALGSPGRSSRRSSGGSSGEGGGAASSSPSAATRSSLYMLAQARDGINEMHPEVLERRIQSMATKLDCRRSHIGGDPAAQASALSAGGKDAFDTVSSCKRVTVTELCARFELGMLLRAETLRSPEKKPTVTSPSPDQHEKANKEPSASDVVPAATTAAPRSSAKAKAKDRGKGAPMAAAAQAGKLTATGVQELRSFFEVYSKRHVEKQRIISSGNSTPSISRGGSGSDLSTHPTALSASKAKLSLLLGSNSHDGPPQKSHHHGLPVSPTFRRPVARVSLEEEKGEEQLQGQSSGDSLSVSSQEQQQQQQQQPSKSALALVPSAGDEGERRGSTEARSHHPRTPATLEIFNHDEIVCLRLIFALFDDNADDFIDEGELLRYAEETGDHASLNQAAECIRLLDVDGDGRIGLWDYINFGARLKELHRANERSLVMDAIRQRFQQEEA